jgi:flagellar basal body rod protein FlgC
MNDIKNNALFGLSISKNNILVAADNISKSITQTQQIKNTAFIQNDNISIKNPGIFLNKNIDLASETIDLIQASRHYESNLKVLGVWSELLDEELNILK